MEVSDLALGDNVTEREKQQQRDRLVTEYYRANENLLACEEEAKRFSRTLQTVSEWFNAIASRSEQESDVAKPDFTDPIYAETVNLPQCTKVEKELRKAQTVFNDLKQRKDALGLKIPL